MFLEYRALSVAVGVAAVSTASFFSETSTHGGMSRALQQRAVWVPQERGRLKDPPLSVLYQPTAKRSRHDVRPETDIDFPIVQARQAGPPPG